MTIRELFIEWLTATRYMRWLEQGHAEQRQDYTERLAEKDQIIHGLKVELAGLKLECDRMRLVLLPMGSPAGAIYAAQYTEGAVHERPPLAPVFDVPRSWEAELQSLMEEDDNGIHGSGRNEINQSGSDDAKESLP